MAEVIVYPAPGLSAGGEMGEVGYAPMQHTTHTQTAFQTFLPTPLVVPLTSFPAVL